MVLSTLECPKSGCSVKESGSTGVIWEMYSGMLQISLDEVTVWCWPAKTPRLTRVRQDIFFVDDWKSRQWDANHEPVIQKAGAQSKSPSRNLRQVDRVALILKNVNKMQKNQVTLVVESFLIAVGNP